jgi:hypothetical protein
LKKMIPFSEREAELIEIWTQSLRHVDPLADTLWEYSVGPVLGAENGEYNVSSESSLLLLFLMRPIILLDCRAPAAAKSERRFCRGTRSDR